MSRLTELLLRLLGTDPQAQTAMRLARERPTPPPEFVDGLRRRLGPRWALATRPPALWLRVAVLSVAGLALLGVAALIAGNG